MMKLLNILQHIFSANMFAQFQQIHDLQLNFHQYVYYITKFASEN